MMPHQRAPPEARIRELTEEREWHLRALENIEAAIQWQMVWMREEGCR